jgi:hypothetical protein
VQQDRVRLRGVEPDPVVVRRVVDVALRQRGELGDEIVGAADRVDAQRLVDDLVFGHLRRRGRDEAGQKQSGGEDTASQAVLNHDGSRDIRNQDVTVVTVPSKQYTQPYWMK